MQEKCVGSLKIKLYVQCTHNLINYGGEVSQLKRNLSQWNGGSDWVFSFRLLPILTGCRIRAVGKRVVWNFNEGRNVSSSILFYSCLSVREQSASWMQFFLTVSAVRGILIVLSEWSGILLPIFNFLLHVRLLRWKLSYRLRVMNSFLNLKI